MSCLGNGYLTGNTLIPVPFEDGIFPCGQQADDAGELREMVFKCFADAGIFISGRLPQESEWPSACEFDVSGRTLSFTLSCCGSERRMSVSASRSRFPVVSGEDSWGRYFIVLSSDGIKAISDYYESASSSSSSSSPPATASSSTDSLVGDLSFRFCAKCVNFNPESMSSIRVFDGVSDRSLGPSFVLKGDISIKPGNNISLSESEDGGGFSVSAEPGAGMGVVNCGCNGRKASSSSLISPDGHTRIFNDTCYDLEPSFFGTVVVDGDERLSRKLKIHSKCKACCTCEMYESIVNDRLYGLFESVKNAKTDLDGYLKTYEENVSKFNRRLETQTLSDVTLSLSGMPAGSNLGPKLSGTGVSGKMNRCAFTAVVRNASFYYVNATIGTMSGTDSIVEASATWSSEDGSPKTTSSNSAGGISGSTFTIYPGRSLVVTFVSVKNSMVGSVVTGGYTGSISVGLSGPNGSIGNLSKTVSV